MNHELDKKLVESFPNLYADRYSDMRYTAMCWGFPGDGWYSIIYEASDKLEAEILKLKRENPPPRFYKLKKKFDNNVIIKINSLIFKYFGFRKGIKGKISSILFSITNFIRPNLGLEHFPCASQVKEKYGRLDINLTSYTDAMDEIIEEATRKSLITCEVCGKPGKRNNYGWLETLCDGCRGFNLEEAEREFEEKEERESEEDNLSED